MAGFAVYMMLNTAKDTARAEESEMRRFEIENPDSIVEGEFRELRVGEGKTDNVLISRFGGKLYATGAYCTHLGAPFAPNGMLFDDKVLCPYHAASYSVVTGISENGPGLDGLPTYEVVCEKGKYYALVPEVL